MRLFEHMVRFGYTVPDTADKRVLPVLERTIQQATLIDADPVTRYYYEGSDRETWLLGRDFPNLAPPFQRMFMDTNRPSKIVSEVHGVTAPTGLPEKWGALFFSVEVSSKDHTWITAIIEGSQDAPENVILAWKGESVRWVTHVYLYALHGQPQPVGPVAIVTYAVSSDGTPVITSDDKPAVLVRPIPSSDLFEEMDKNPGLLETYADEVVNLVKPMWLTICFMNCRNVHLEDRKVSEALLKKWKKKGDNRQYLQYKTLVIESMRKKLESDGESASKGLQHAMHVCRGHFKDYRESGLFGRHKGVYWWDHTVRGNPEHGTVQKDYKVVPDDGKA